MSLDLAAVMLVKDEADVIEATIIHAYAQGCKRVLVSDNASSDGTRDILADLSRGLEGLLVQDDPDPAYRQSAKTSALAQQAFELGAEWILPIDADEIWFHDSGVTLAEQIDARAENAHILEFELFTHLVTALDPEGETPFHRMPYRLMAPQPIGKVAVKWHPDAVIHAGNHGATHPAAAKEWLVGGKIAHCPYRSAEQMTRKAINGGRAYEAAPELPHTTGLHWRELYEHWKRGGDDTIREIFDTHFWYEVPTASGLAYDPIPVRA